MQPYQVKHQGQTYVIEHKPPTRRNKHLRLSVHLDGRITLSTPMNTDKTEITQFLQKNTAWIAKQFAQCLPQPSPEQRYGDKSEHLLLGAPITLYLTHYQSSQLCENILYLQVNTTDPIHVEQKLLQFYRQYALNDFPTRLKRLIAKTPWVNTMPLLKVRRMKRRWGSCAHAGHITLNTLLIKAPPLCIDHVIIHELCHFKEFNHSKRFYALMDKSMPDWRDHKAQLNALTPTLIV